MTSCCHTQDDQTGHTCTGDCACQHDPAPTKIAVRPETATEHAEHAPGTPARTT